MVGGRSWHQKMSADRPVAHRVVGHDAHYAKCDELRIILRCNNGVSSVRHEITLEVLLRNYRPNSATGENFGESAPLMTDYAVCCSKQALSTLTILPGRVIWGLGLGFSSVYGLWPGSCCFSYAS